MGTRIYYLFTIIFAALVVISACKETTSTQTEEPVENAPATPMGLSAMPGDEEVFLTWDANNESNLSHYNIYQGTSSGDLEEVAEVPAGTESYEATGLTNDMTYYFTIDAENADGNTSDPTAETTAMPVAKYVVVGSAISGAGANVHVRHKSMGIEGATVSINGEVLEDRDNGRYYKFPYDERIADGEAIELQVEFDDVKITGSGFIPYQVVVTEPADSSVFAPGEMINVLWTSEADPDMFDVLGRFTDEGTNYEGLYNVPGDQREASLDAALFPSDGTPIELYMVSKNNGEFTGPYAEGSTMGIRTTTPPSTTPTFFVME